MVALGRLLVVLCLSAALVHGGRTWAAADRQRLLSEAGVYGTYAVVKADHAWWTLDSATRQGAIAEVKAVLGRHADRVLIDTYLLRGLSTRGDVLLRLHATELRHNQQVLLDLMGTTFGHHLELVDVLTGLTRKAVYVPSLETDTQKALKSAAPPASGVYGIVIPVRKDAAWWNLNDQERTRMMQAHTEAALPYLKTVARKLYQSTGLDDFDFLTYFETSDLLAFHQLVRALEQVEEYRHARRFGHPTLIGTVHTLDEVLEILGR